MAWTAPRTWATGELVTAAMQNSHVRDNLRYLKGLDGTVTIESALIVAAASASLKANATSGNPIYYWSTAGTDQYHMYYDLASGYLGIVESGVATRMAIKDGGNVGIGNTSPISRLHITDTVMSEANWNYDGLDGTSRTIIPDGAGDVVYGLSFTGLIRSSSALGGGISVFTVNAISTVYTPGSGAVTIFTEGSGANTIIMTFNANGSVTIARGAGSVTYKVALKLFWM